MRRRSVPLLAVLAAALPVPAVAQVDPETDSRGSLDICLYTGKPSTPYVVLGIKPSLKGEYPDPRNIIPAPAAGCPKTIAASAKPTATATATATPRAAAATPAPTATVAPATTTTTAADPVPAAAAPRRIGASELPLTGGDPLPLLGFGTGLILVGAGLRRTLL